MPPDDARREAERRIEEACRSGSAELFLRGLGLTELPESLGQLTQLQELYIGQNQLTGLPEALGRLPMLRHLDLHQNRLTGLPEALGGLTQLRELYLSQNQLTGLPEALGGLAQLHGLDLRQNQLTRLPEALGGLTQLQELYLSQNQLTGLPEALGGLTQLRGLYLSQNQLTGLPEALGGLTQLKTLDLNENALAYIHESLGRLPKLKALFLARNRLTELPESLGRLPKLQILDLAENGLTGLPESLGRLTQLKELFLTGNRLTRLPESLGRLTQLQKLDLSANKLTSLPWSLDYLKQLRSLSLHNNPELGIPPEVLGLSPAGWGGGAELVTLPKPEAILNWYFRNRAATSKRPILEAKVILVGWGMVGKTSLRRRLLSDTFDPNEEQTHKIEIAPWPVTVGQDRVILNVWDFGGQEVMHATHQFFLTKRSLYVLVLAGRQKAQGAQDAEYWLRLIESFGGGSPTVVVLNKQRGCPFDLNQQSLREKYPFIRHFVSTDCDPPLRLDELRALILAEVDKLPDLRTEFDARWMAIKDDVARLKATGTKRMTVEEYADLCRAKGERDEKWQKWLLGFLHDLGVVVCFHDDHRLADDGLLDPQWVVDGIYRVLHAPALSGRDGRATYQQIRGLLPADEYTGPAIRILLDMMEKFQLAFWLNDGRTDLVIPELMTEQEPDWKATFPDPETGLRFELKYDFLPGGLVPRFLVATHHLSADHERWRSGVILRNKERNAALVRGDATGSPPRIRILVTGPVATRRGLLDIIRHEFDKIHATISGLGVQERVPVPGHSSVEPLNYDDLIAFEAAGRKTYSVIIHGRLVELPLPELLDGIDPKSERTARARRKQGGVGPDAPPDGPAGPEVEALRDALCAAFDQSELDAMLRTRMNVRREEEIGSGRLKQVAFELIRWAVRRGRLAELIRAARQANEDNPELKAFCEGHPHLVP
ncbi:leucine-rich repeat domain-containing protein [bacterium]|nr:leucine-rich repeat domain-containing protein [bacterium]